MSKRKQRIFRIWLSFLCLWCHLSIVLAGSPARSLKAPDTLNRFCAGTVSANPRTRRWQKSTAQSRNQARNNCACNSRNNSACNNMWCVEEQSRAQGEYKQIQRWSEIECIIHIETTSKCENSSPFMWISFSFSLSLSLSLFFSSHFLPSFTHTHTHKHTRTHENSYANQYYAPLRGTLSVYHSIPTSISNPKKCWRICGHVRRPASSTISRLNDHCPTDCTAGGPCPQKRVTVSRRQPSKSSGR